MLRKVLISTGVVSVLLLVGLFAPVQAQTNSQSITIPVDTIIQADEGSTTELAIRNVNQDMVGMDCSVVAHGENQSSVHSGNNLVIASGSDSVTLQDVERESGVTTTTNGTLTLGQTITVSLVMGADKVFSAGMDVTVTCVEPEPTMATGNVSFNDVCGIEDDSYTVKETDGVSYEVNDQRVDGVGTVTITATADDGYELNGDTEWSFDFTNELCEQPSEEVCRDGDVVTINPSEREETDTDAPCAEVLGVGNTPEQLPNTGIGAVAASVAGSTSIFAGVRSWAKSRSQMKDVLRNR